jgi:Zn-dependent protease/CBS domain-containing protein
MFTARWRIFRLAGIPIYLDLSWLIILVLITWTLANVFASQVPRLPRSDYWVMGLISALAFFICVVLHELGHAIVGRAQGMPIRGITLFMFGGVAELGGEPPSARSEFWMAIAGPIVSAVLGAIFWATASFGNQAGWSTPVVVVLVHLAVINWLVLAFNMIPAFPLDGGRVLRSALWGISGNLRRSTYWASLLGQGFACVLIISAVLQIVRGSGGLFSGLWLGLIGLFLYNAARESYQQVVIRQALEGEPVSQFMNREPIVVPPFLDLRSWVEDYVYRHHRKVFPVAANGHLEGYVSTRALQRFPRAEWEHHKIAEAMNHDVKAITIPPTADALTALGKMQRTGSSRLLVTEGDRLVGILSLKDLMHFMRVKLDLENDRPDDDGHQEHSQDQEHYAHS